METTCELVALPCQLGEFVNCRLRDLSVRLNCVLKSPETHQPFDFTIDGNVDLGIAPISDARSCRRRKVGRIVPCRRIGACRHVAGRGSIVGARRQDERWPESAGGDSHESLSYEIGSRRSFRSAGNPSLNFVLVPTDAISGNLASRRKSLCALEAPQCRPRKACS